ncbi:serine/threonine-protein kinase [Nesterenkonia populi]|uniref:serine/threonine-protein kinase n=1 Tax=Nesterenkonia populi TaxID=1591087 RepID=UPI0011BDE0C1|nr:serine/threonine-protein kinase [Nesterenkonia populi]
MGERVGRYRLEEVIGVGSFATVHRASDDLLGDTVVVKLLAENHSLNPEIRERFIAEGRSLRKIHSPAVVTVHDMGESPRQQPYLVLEFADRGTLADRVRKLWAEGWRATREDMLAFARPLAEALEAVHRAKLVHRDLSPGNLLLATAPGAEGISGAGSTRLLGSDERLLLADLGMCKDLAVNSGLTVSGGTAGFRPPEQNGPGLVDTRADIWSMSAVLKWLAQQSDLPQTFYEVLGRGMRTDPSHRLQDAGAWLAEVERALAPPEPVPQALAADESDDAEPPVTTGPYYPPYTSDQPTQMISPQRPLPTTDGGTGRKSKRRRPLRSALAVCAVVALAAVVGLGAGWFLRGPGGLPAETENAALSISGPEEVQVGETATFEVRESQVEDWVWLLPTGTYQTAEEVSVTPTAPGWAEVVLRGRAADGTELEARRTIRVVE